MQRRRMRFWGTLFLVGPIVIGPAQQVAAQRGAQVECAEVVEATRGARTLAELRQRAIQKTNDDSALRRCGRALEADPMISSMARAELQQVEQAAQRAAQQLRTAPSENAMQLSINQRIVEARRAGAMRVQQIKGSIQPGQRDEPNTGSTTPPPPPAEAPPPITISNLVPATLVPGSEFAIEGSGLGSDPLPTVRLELGQGSGSNLNLLVTGWSDTFITGIVPEHLSGVVETNTAQLRVRVGMQEASRFVAFAPIHVTQEVDWVLKRPDDTPWWELGGSVQASIFPGSTLTNNWRTKEWVLSHQPGPLPPYSQCDVNYGTMPTAGQTTLAATARLNWFFPNISPCTVIVRIEGPRGTATGL